MKTNAILVNYGTHRFFTDAGNVVECRYCRHFVTAKNLCLEHNEPARPTGRCFANFEREVGSDDA